MGDDEERFLIVPSHPAVISWPARERGTRREAEIFVFGADRRGEMSLGEGKKILNDLDKNLKGGENAKRLGSSGMRTGFGGAAWEVAAGRAGLWGCAVVGCARYRALPAPRGDGDGLGRVWWAHPAAGTLLPCWLVPSRVTARGKDAPASCQGGATLPALPRPLLFRGSLGTRGEPGAVGRAALASFGALTSPLLSPADPLPEPRRGLAGLHLGASPRRQMPLHGRHPRPGHLLP